MTKVVSPMNLIGIQKIGPSSFNVEYGSGANFTDAIWQEFILKTVEAGYSTERIMFGVSWPVDDLTPPQFVHYFAGFESNEANTPEEFEMLKVEGGNYFTYQYIGPMKSVDEGFQNAYNVAFPASGLEGRQGQHLEIYPADYNPSLDPVTFEILIPIQ